MTRVLLVSGDVIGARMAGPAIRTVELGRALAGAGHEVTIAAPAGADLKELGLSIAIHDDAVIGELARTADVIVGQGWPLERWPQLRQGPGALVVDLYDPYHLEGLVLDATEPDDERCRRHQGRMATLTHQLDDGDFFLCAGERQRDMWLGALSARGRVNPETYSDDATLRRLIDVVPFGLPAVPPDPRRRAIREAFPAIAEDDLVLLWGGGIYDWFDPLTLVRAASIAIDRLPALRLVFHAAPHPSPAVAPMAMVERTRSLAADLGLTDRHVFFNDTWVPYDERADWLCDADVGVSTHLTHIETDFAFRTRVLDYFWAGLPVLCTAGDVLAAEVERHGLGIAVPANDPARLAQGIVQLSDPAFRAACRARIAGMAAEHSWALTASPLLQFCAAPRKAPDRRDRGGDTAVVDDVHTRGVGTLPRRLLRAGRRRVSRLRGRRAS